LSAELLRKIIKYNKIIICNNNIKYKGSYVHDQGWVPMLDNRAWGNAQNENFSAKTVSLLKIDQRKHTFDFSNSLNICIYYCTNYQAKEKRARNDEKCIAS
jgi:hypothetical protein